MPLTHKAGSGNSKIINCTNDDSFDFINDFDKNSDPSAIIIQRSPGLNVNNRIASKDKNHNNGFKFDMRNVTHTKETVDIEINTGGYKHFSNTCNKILKKKSQHEFSGGVTPTDEPVSLRMKELERSIEFHKNSKSINKAKGKKDVNLDPGEVKNLVNSRLLSISRNTKKISFNEYKNNKSNYKRTVDYEFEHLKEDMVQSTYKTKRAAYKNLKLASMNKSNSKEDTKIVKGSSFHIINDSWKKLEISDISNPISSANNKKSTRRLLNGEADFTKFIRKDILNNRFLKVTFFLENHNFFDKNFAMKKMIIKTAI